MKNYLSVALIVLVAVIVLGQMSSERVAANQSVVGQKWEYKVVRPSPYSSLEPEGPNAGYDSFRNRIEDRSGLNGWGEQGWELVSVVVSPEGSNPLLFYFKRPKR